MTLWLDCRSGVGREFFVGFEAESKRAYAEMLSAKQLHTQVRSEVWKFGPAVQQPALF